MIPAPSTSPKSLLTSSLPRYASVSLPVGIMPPRNFEYEIPEGLRAQVRPGSVVWVEFQRRKRWGIAAGVSETPEFPGFHKPLAGLAEIPDRVLKTAYPLIQRLSGRYFSTYAAAARTAMPLSLLLRPRPSWPDGQGLHTAQGLSEIEPSDSQKEALAVLKDSFENHGRPVYCWGPTGSGKTYVLLSFLTELLKKNRRAIYLVPEIALTPQFMEIFTQALPKGTRLARWSSELKISEKYAVWNAVMDGSVDIVLGTRSAAFLPLPNLGAIIVDEEQDPSFKQEQPPSFHAREIALWRGQEEGCLAVLASATPSLESYRMMEDGLLRRADIAVRYHQKESPEIITVPFYGRKNVLGPVILDALKENLSEGRGAIVFHNRRGSLRGMSCQLCGTAVLCSRCDLPLILHKETADGKVQEQLRCHHCGIRKNPPERCPRCFAGREKLEAHSFGTQHIEEELKRELGTPILRLDKDTAKSSREIYERFKAGEAPVLIGTQLVTKGWHFPKVGLVAVLNADTEMSMPDFRSAERTFQTMVQVAGRTGRADIAGRVIIATRHPGHYVFTSLQNGDMEAFYRKELSLRKELRLPPYWRLLAMELRGKKREDVERATQALRQAIEEKLAGPAQNDAPEETAEVVGSAPGFFQRVRGLWRFQVVLRLSENSPQALQAVGEALARSKSSKVSLRLHLDPYRLL